jgi:hypothetical protein
MTSNRRKRVSKRKSVKRGGTVRNRTTRTRRNQSFYKTVLRQLGIKGGCTGQHGGCEHCNKLTGG